MDQTAFRALISGQRRGLTATLQRAGLSCLAPFYSLAVRLRNRAFDLRLKKTHRAAVPVVSVGNITTGGTGKTPMVAYLANWFREREVKVVLLSRGYRGFQSSGARKPITNHQSPITNHNDEKLVLDKLCPGVPHFQDPDRVASARTAVEQHAAQLLILDDGFQHRRLGRDLDIVLFDALNPFGYGRLLPRGLLREPLSGLKRADVIVLTRADQCSEEAKSRILEVIRKHAPKCPIVEAAFRPDRLMQSSGDTQPAGLESIKGNPIIAFCGIGNPEAFQRTLASCDVRDFRAFPDHHHYMPADLTEIEQLIEQHNAAAIVTTLKDLVKIERDDLAGRPLWALGMTTEITTGADVLETLLERTIAAQ